MPRVKSVDPCTELRYWATDFRDMCEQHMGRRITYIMLGTVIGQHKNTVGRKMKSGEWSAQEVRLIADYLKFTDEEKQSLMRRR